MPHICHGVCAIGRAACSTFTHSAPWETTGGINVMMVQHSGASLPTASPLNPNHTPITCLQAIGESDRELPPSLLISCPLRDLSIEILRQAAKLLNRLQPPRSTANAIPWYTLAIAMDRNPENSNCRVRPHQRAQSSSKGSDNSQGLQDAAVMHTS
jgi:hypothetical protein